MNKVNANVNVTKNVFFVTYLENGSVAFKRSAEFDSKKEAMEFAKSRADKILYFTVDRQEVISFGDKSFRDNIVQGRRQYIGEVFTKERIEKEEKSEIEKQSILNRLDFCNVELAVKTSNHAYEFLLPGEKVFNRDFEQVYPKAKVMNLSQQKTR